MEPSQANQKFQSDVQKLQQEQRQANICCKTAPMSCLKRGGSEPPPPITTGDPEKDEQAINAYCDRVRQASADGQGTSNSAGMMCLSKHSTCQSTANALISEYTTLLGNCGSCNARNIYSSAITTFKGYLKQCADLDSQVRALGNQGLSNSSSTTAAQLCGDGSREYGASSMPNMGGENGEDMQAQTARASGYSCEENPNQPNCGQCATNPDAPGCKATNTDSGRGGEAGLASATQEEGEFNLPDLGDMSTAPGSLFSGTPGEAPTVGTIANNAGGGIPGGEGGGAKLGGGPRAGYQGGSSGGVDIGDGYADISGYTNPNGGGSGLGTDEPGVMGYGGRVPANANGTQTQSVNYDLKQHLVNRFGGNAPATDIHNMHVDIWLKMTERIQSKCRLGIMLGCDGKSPN